MILAYAVAAQRKTSRSAASIIAKPNGDCHERYPDDHLRGGIGAGGNHPILRRRASADPHQHEAGLPGPHRIDRDTFRAWNVGRFAGSHRIVDSPESIRSVQSKLHSL